MHRTVHIGLAGFGTVGGGVYALLKENRELIRQRTDIDIDIKTICDVDARKVRDGAKGVAVTSDWKDLLADGDIDTIVELIGGIEPAKSIILEALRSGRNVVTANKKLLAEAGGEIFELSQKAKSKLGFEAAVGGGIPCILALRSGLVGNRVRSVIGILNGTTNYILTRMQDEGLSFQEALKRAQEKGFAEADPTFDIEGFDAGHKIALLSMLAYNKKIDYGRISIEGITRIGELDIAYAREMGYTIKLLGVSKHTAGGVDIRVHPTMLQVRHPLASVRNEFNAIMFEGDMTGPITLHGKGAGSHPTASAVVSDIVQIAQKQDQAESSIRMLEDARYLEPTERLSRYYMRVHTEDRPGILSKISGVLADHRISIASVIQKESDTPHVPLVIITHEAVEAGMMRAVEEINGFGFVGGSVTLIRIEDYSGGGEAYG
jgi:homoserine dehydrogenase